MVDFGLVKNEFSNSRKPKLQRSRQNTGPEKEQDMFEAVMERTAWGGGEMGSTPTPRPPQASAHKCDV